MHLSPVGIIESRIRCCNHRLMFGRDFKSNFIQRIFIRPHKYGGSYLPLLAIFHALTHYTGSHFIRDYFIHISSYH